MEKMAWDGPKWGREDLFPTNPDLADILGRMDLDFDNFQILTFWTCPNPCDKDFRILDLSKPLRQRFQNSGPVQTLATKISEFWTCPNPCDRDFRILDFWISRFPDVSNLAWVGPGLGLGWARGSAVLGRGGGL